jgi:hypothetical protein
VAYAIRGKIVGAALRRDDWANPDESLRHRAALTVDREQTDERPLWSLRILSLAGVSVERVDLNALPALSPAKGFAPTAPKFEQGVPAR